LHLAGDFPEARFHALGPGGASGGGQGGGKQKVQFHGQFLAQKMTPLRGMTSPSASMTNDKSHLGLHHFVIERRSRKVILSSIIRHA
jgi:hypothetical protein